MDTVFSIFLVKIATIFCYGMGLIGIDTSAWGVVNNLIIASCLGIAFIRGAITGFLLSVFTGMVAYKPIRYFWGDDSAIKFYKDNMASMTAIGIIVVMSSSKCY